MTIECGGGFSADSTVHVFDVELGRFTPGDYTVEVVNLDPPVSLFTGAFTVIESHAADFFPFVDYTDHWWNPQESGWGISIMQHPSDQLFAVWFVYNQSGQPVWYTLQPGAWTSPQDFAGPVYRTMGPYFGGPFDPTQVDITQVGSATLSFTDSTTGKFTYMIDGVAGSKAITRLPF